MSRSPCVLLTGSTGLLGGAVLAHWLSTNACGKIYLPVRAGSPREALSRAQRSAARFIGERAVAERSGRCVPLVSDLTAEDALHDVPLDDVTHVLNLAANTSFRSRSSVYRVNVGGALRLAQRMQRAPRLERYLHVGTAVICGGSPPRIVHEDDYPRAEITHLVPYSASKAEAELRLREAAPDLPLVVARPSIIVGHTSLGCEASGSIFWVMRAVDQLGLTAWDLESRFDSVPVDWAARALSALLFKERLHAACYHISAGQEFSVAWSQIAATFAGARGDRVPRHYRVGSVSDLAKDASRFNSLFGLCDEQRMLDALELYYRFGALNVVFDNDRLLKEGVPPPPRLTEYLPHCLARPPGKTIAEQMRDDD